MKPTPADLRLLALRTRTAAARELPLAAGLPMSDAHCESFREALDGIEFLLGLIQQLGPGKRQADAPRGDLVERLREHLSVVIGEVAGVHEQLRVIFEEHPDLDYLNDEFEEPLEMLAEISEAARCRSCGCTHTSPCEEDEAGPCGWAETDLCTACVPS